MAVNKVVYGEETLVDLTEDSVTPDTLMAGVTAHNAAGEAIEGRMTMPDISELSGKVDTLINNDVDKSVRTIASEVVSGSDLASTLATLVGSDVNKSIRTIANLELAAQLIPANANAAMDTLQEIADWIQKHPDDAAAINSSITSLTASINKLNSSITTINNNIDSINTNINQLKNRTDPMGWTSGTEVDLGGGLYGMRRIGTFTWPEAGSEQYSILISSIGSNGKIVSYGGYVDMGDDTYHMNITVGTCIWIRAESTAPGGVTSTFVGIIKDNYNRVRLFARNPVAATNKVYDVWVMYTK